MCIRISFTNGQNLQILGTKEFENKLYVEIRGRIKEADVSVPLRRGDYYYYETTEEGKEYAQHCRRPVSDKAAQISVHDTMPTGPDAPPQHVILDENVQAQQHEYYCVNAFEVQLVLPTAFYCLFLHSVLTFTASFSPGESKQ